MNHLGDTNKMVETPISDSTPHNVADLGMQIRRLERQLNAANERIKRMEEAHAVDDASSLATMLAYEIALAKIKRLEDIIKRASIAFFRDGSDGHVASQMLQILEEERGKP